MNGGEPKLRLVVQALDEAWEFENFATDGLLYKSEAGGDWTWRGTDPDVLHRRLRPGDRRRRPDAADRLPRLPQQQHATRSSRPGLAARLDVEAFARYLAFEDLVGNTDDIDGPGNNSYLRYDAESGGFTVVAWDHNLAFGGDGSDWVAPGERPEGMARRGCRERMPEPARG